MDMDVANVALKIWHPEGTEQMSMVYGQAVHHLCMSCDGTPPTEQCVDHNVILEIYVKYKSGQLKNQIKDGMSQLPTIKIQWLTCNEHKMSCDVCHP